MPVLGPGWGWGFAEVSRRRGDFALVAAAALARVADGRVIEARLGLCGVADRPLRLGAVEIAVEGATAADLTGGSARSRGSSPPPTPTRAPITAGTSRGCSRSAR